MEESLKAWIELVCRDILNVADADCNLFEENLFTVGKHVLQLPDSSFEEIHQKGAQTLNLREDDTSLFATATIILKYAVSSECKHKSEYVSHIISMDSDIQENLMAAIQDQTLVINDHSDADESFEITSVLEGDETLQSEPFYSPQKNQESSKTTCDNCHQIENELANHTKQIDELLKREKVLEEKLKKENTEFLNKNMDMQDIVREKDSLLQEKILEIENYEERERELLLKVEAFDILTEKVTMLQDEVDVLQPLVKRAESAETQLSRMHEKLDKLDGVKDQLKAEVESHNTTQKELLELKVEIDSLRKAKVQVVEYRDRCAENAITIGDLTSQLTSSQEEVQKLTAKLNQVSEGHQITESYSKSLVDELKVASEALRNSEREGGIGGGISELNPEISKELNRLRVENAELLNKLDLSSVDSLDRLQQDLSDQQCINTSLQQKWTKSKDLIETLTKNIVELEATVASGIKKLESATQLHQDMMATAEKERKSAALHFESKLAHVTQRMDDSNFILFQGKQAVVLELQADYNATFTTLFKTERDLSVMTALKNQLTGDLQEKEEALEVECKKRKRAEEEYFEEKKTMLMTFEDEKQALAEKQESNEQELKKNFKLQLDTERSKNLNLAADMEEEKLKRRKLDREKRFHESECHRYKSQLQMQSNSSESNAEVETALKEMKSMQEQLDAARAQITYLQNHSVSSEHVQGGQGVASDNNKKNLNSTARRTLGNSAQRVNHRGDNLSTYVEQTEMYERKIELMTRERREMIAKNLEENKERMELNQKLLQCEKETASFKSKVTKLTLEKERLSRRLAKQAEVEQENIVPLL